LPSGHAAAVSLTPQLPQVIWPPDECGLAVFRKR